MTAVDPKYIEEVCSATWEALYRFVYFKVQNREEAEDITQETYVKAFSYLQNGKVAPNKYIAFLKKVATNLLRDVWRKKKRRGIPVSIESIHPKFYAVGDHAETSTQRHFIENALAKLNEEQRTVIKLRILSGLSVADTARVMKKEEVAIRVMQHRALKNLAPQGITGEYPIQMEDLAIVNNNGKEAFVTVSDESSPIKKVYLQRLVRQDSTGIWTVVGYDPR